jgi:UDP:flavonoid glycosyltransferase YjiC (YdhE family)
LAVASAGAGPPPIPYAKLTEAALSEAIEFALLPSTREAAQAVGESIRAEDGTKGGVESFHKHLPLLNMR